MEFSFLVGREPSLEGKRTLKLLVVEDHAHLFEQIELFKDVMEDEVDINCRHAHTGEEALKVISEWEPSVVVLDVYMPDMTGFEILERCGDQSIPFIVTSSNVSEEIREASLDRGACAFIPKTSNPEEIESLFYLFAELADYTECQH